MSSVSIAGDTSGSILLAAPAIAGSSTVTLPTTGGTVRTTTTSGTVLQIVQSSMTGQITTTSTSFSATGLSASITPSSSSNKILVTVMLNNTRCNNAGHIFATVYRNGSNLAPSGPSGLAQSFYAMYCPSGVEIQGNGNISYLDSPSSTSAVTYAVYYGVDGGSTSAINWNGQTSYIQLMEIAA